MGGVPTRGTRSGGATGGTIGSTSRRVSNLERESGSIRGSKEGEVRLTEDDMARDNDSVCGEVEAPVPLVIRRVPKEDTTSKARHKLVGVVAERLG
jgi:hypothetical protein